MKGVILAVVIAWLSSGCTPTAPSKTCIEAGKNVPGSNVPTCQK